MKSFRVADPAAATRANTTLEAGGHNLSDYLNACVQWLSREPHRALAELEPHWPAPRHSGRPTSEVAYAIHTGHEWLGEPDLLPDGHPHRDAGMFHPFTPTDPDNPYRGLWLTVRCGVLPNREDTSPYLLGGVLAGPRALDGEMNLRMTHAVHDALYGPGSAEDPRWAQWQALREQRRGERHPKETR